MKLDTQVSLSIYTHTCNAGHAALASFLKLTEYCFILFQQVTFFLGGYPPQFSERNMSDEPNQLRLIIHGHILRHLRLALSPQMD